MSPRFKNTSSAFVFAFPILIGVVVVSFQNCAEFEPYKPEVGTALLLPMTSERDSNCLSSQADACLFEKNAITQNGGPIEGLKLADIQTLQVNAIDLSQHTTGNTLANASFKVSPSAGGYLFLKDKRTKWRVGASEAEAQSKLSQLIAFYTANSVASRIHVTTGVFYAVDKSIKIITDDDVSGWVPSKNQIHLAISPAGKSMAHDASVVSYFLALANLDFSNDGAIHRRSAPKHRSCQGPSAVGKNQECCSDRRGCASAIASGQADYLVAIAFPESPAVGDGWLDSLEGQTICSSSHSRHPQSMANMTADDVFALCTDSTGPGEIFAMGSFYSSIWWAVRNRPEVDKNEIDSLFMRHLKTLNGDDDFVTVQSKIKTIDEAQFASKYWFFFQQEFRQRLL